MLQTSSALYGERATLGFTLQSSISVIAEQGIAVLLAAEGAAA